jgi:tryptophan synthase beta subunit
MPETRKEDVVVVGLSGRGDKDLRTYTGAAAGKTAAAT